MNNQFTIQDIQQHHDIVLLTIQGSLDSVVAYQLQEHFDTLIKNKRFKYIIDLEELEYISSAGVGLFSAAVLDLQRQHGQIVFIHIPEQAYHVFRITRLIEIFTIADNIQQAVELLESPEKQ